VTGASVTKGIETNERFPLSRIFLSLDNPRHEPKTSEAQAIAALCEKEDVLPLARDIAKYGLNPLERFGLIAFKSKQRTKAPPRYYTFEGNRRLCALKLLNDPELAPANLRKHFAKVAEEATFSTSTVPVAIFEDKATADHWLERIHNGPQGGIGRVPWNPEQKQRHYGGAKNRTAQALLDYAVDEGMLSAEDREGKLTTVQRFVGNSVFREALGLDVAGTDTFSRTRPKHEFDKLVKMFIADLLGKTKVNSRMNSEDIKRYARSLESAAKASNKRVEPEPLTAPNGKKRRAKHKPVQHEKAVHIELDDEIWKALHTLKNGKLLSLYWSICSVELDPHAPLVAVGIWSFTETLTAAASRDPKTDFQSFLSNQKLRSYGLTGDLTTIRAVMGRIAEYGNTTKHHPVSATFNGDQMHNDMITFRDVVLKCIEEAIARK
jgi:hypothetical protein